MSWGNFGSYRIYKNYALAADWSFDYGQYWAYVGLSVSVSLIAIVLWGTLSGSMIPFVLKKLNLDPATSSAPFVATLVDVTGLIIYFTVAGLFLTGKLL